MLAVNTIEVATPACERIPTPTIDTLAIEASESTTFDLHCVTHPVGEERCSSSHTCSIRPVWMMLQQRIDDVLDGVNLADLLEDESVVRARVGFVDAKPAAEGTHDRTLPVLQG